MSDRYTFGLSQEDARVDGPALDVGPRTRVLAVCGAGDMPLSLAAMGARAVVAVDFSDAQLHLAQLKAAAVEELSRQEVIAFLGYRPDRGGRPAWFDRLRFHLPPETVDFWSRHERWIRRGVITQGRYERYLFAAARVARLALGRRIRALCACETVAEAGESFDRDFDTPLVRGLFRIVFHPAVYGRGAVTQRALSQAGSSEAPMADRFFHTFRAICSNTPPATNDLLQMHLLGEIASDRAVPYFLSEEGFERARNALPRITWRAGDITEVIAREAGDFEAFHLSNIVDWMPDEAFLTSLAHIADQAPPGSKVVWRALHAYPPLQHPVFERLDVDVDGGEALRATDRFASYRIYPATVRRT